MGELTRMKADLTKMEAEKEEKTNYFNDVERTHNELLHVIREQQKSYEQFSGECSTIIRTVEKALLQLNELMGRHANLREPLVNPDGSVFGGGNLLQGPIDKIKDGQTKDAFKDEDYDEMKIKLAIGSNVAKMDALPGPDTWATSADPTSELRYKLMTEHQLDKTPKQSNLARTLAMLQAPPLKSPLELAMLQQKAHQPNGDGFNAEKAAQEIEKERASDFLKLEAKQLGSLGLGQLATRVAAEPFEKVKDLIQRLIDTLNSQKSEETTKHTWCDEQTAKLEDQLANKEMNVDEAQVKHDAAFADYHNNENEIADVMEQRTGMAERELATQRQFKANKERLAQEIKDLAQVIQDLDTIIGDMQNTESDTLDGKLTPIIEVLKWTRNQLSNSKSDSEIHAKEIEHEHDVTMSEFSVLEQKLEIAHKAGVAKQGLLHSAMLNDKTSLEDHERLLKEAQKYHETLVKNCATPVETWEQRNQRRQEEIDALKEALEILQGHTDAITAAHDNLQDGHVHDDDDSYVDSEEGLAIGYTEGDPKPVP